MFAETKSSWQLAKSKKAIAKICFQNAASLNYVTNKTKYFPNLNSNYYENQIYFRSARADKFSAYFFLQT